MWGEKISAKVKVDNVGVQFWVNESRIYRVTGMKLWCSVVQSDQAKTISLQCFGK